MSEKKNPVTKYLSEVKSEMKKVTWPTKKDVTNHTIIVICISLAIAIFLGALDFLFTHVLENILSR
jgi:preprotein translocase subunit SecE